MLTMKMIQDAVTAQKSAGDYYIAIMHPRMVHDLRTIAARSVWKEQQHRRRWERRYGRPYPEPEMELGRFEGAKLIDWHG